MLKLLRRESSIVDQPKEATNKVWKDIREGLKLRNIVQSMRINAQGEAQFGSQISKLII